MKILMVYPYYPDDFWAFKTALKFISRKASMPPLGLLTVAAMLPKEWITRVVDLNVRPLSDEQIAWADMVFVSAMLVQSTSAQEVINRSKAAGKIVVAGGPVFTNMAHLFTGVDCFVKGEAEVTLQPFLDDLAAGTLKPEYSSTLKPKLHDTLAPMWELIDFKDYAFMLLQYSRGCPWQCDFCDITGMFGRVPRVKKTEQMIAEFDNLYQAGYRGTIFLVDDNFIGNRLHVKEFLKEFAVWQRHHNYPFQLTTEASVDLADHEDLMLLMQQSNFSKVFLGIESVSQESLLGCHKDQNAKRDLVVVVKKVQSYGMQVYGGFIVGLDKDPPSVFDQLINYIQNTGVVNAMVGLLQAVPGTDLWNRLKSEGRLLEDSTGNNTSARLNFKPQMDKELLIAGYKRILSTIYSKKNYYRRIWTFIKHYQPTSKSRIKVREIIAVIKSSWHIGVVSNKRWLYWWLLAKTSFTKIKAVPVAIELAIMGLHFEKVTIDVCKEE